MRQEGIEKLLDGLSLYLPEPEYSQEFGARVYKIGRDTAGNRLTYLKVTGGTLRVKMMIGNEKSSAGEETWEEKADQLRLYNGGSYETADSVPAGEVCAITGLTKTFAGQGLGYESENLAPVLEPVLTYRLSFPPDVDPVTALGKLRQLEEEEPQLHVLWQEEKREIHMQVMGQVQMEILKISCGSASDWKRNSMREVLSIRRRWRSRWKASDILNPCDIMRKYTCC